MSSLELQQNIVEQTRDLPPQLLKEVADFVAFLRNKYVQQTDASLPNLSTSEEQHVEEEFVNYKHLYPIE